MVESYKAHRGSHKNLYINNASSNLLILQKRFDYNKLMIDFFTNVLILNAMRYPWNQKKEYCEVLCIIIRVSNTHYSALTSFINDMIRHKISHQSKMIFSLIHLSVRKNDKYYESILIVSSIFHVTNYLFIPIKLIDARICISYFGTLLLPIILWRLRWNLRCRINFFNSLTINLEMLSLC